MGLSVKTPDFKKTIKKLERFKRMTFEEFLHRYGQKGVEALSSATPRDTGLTAESWSYKITRNGERYILSWHNSIDAGNVPLVILLQYGHGTNGGGYVEGRDFINPAMEPVFREISLSLKKEVKG